MLQRQLFECQLRVSSRLISLPGRYVPKREREQALQKASVTLASSIPQSSVSPSSSSSASSTPSSAPLLTHKADELPPRLCRDANTEPEIRNRVINKYCVDTHTHALTRAHTRAHYVLILSVEPSPHVQREIQPDLSHVVWLWTSIHAVVVGEGGTATHLCRPRE